MTANSSRDELIERLRYTFITADYGEIDVLISGLLNKENFEELCEEFFRGCRIDSSGQLIPAGFFADDSGSASLQYAMYGILGNSPETFLLKHRVTRVKFIRGNLSGCFRIPTGLFSLPSLEILVIRGIGITRLPEACGKAKSLRVLDLSFNHFTDIPEVILKLPRLSALNMSHNRLTSLPAGLGRLKRLRILNLKGNEIEFDITDWHRLQNLRIVDLSMNRIKEVPDAIRTLVSLNEIRLSYNDMPASTEAHWERRVREEAEQGSLGIGG